VAVEQASWWKSHGVDLISFIAAIGFGLLGSAPLITGLSTTDSRTLQVLALGGWLMSLAFAMTIVILRRHIHKQAQQADKSLQTLTDATRQLESKLAKYAEEVISQRQTLQEYQHLSSRTIDQAFKMHGQALAATPPPTQKVTDQPREADHD